MPVPQAQRLITTTDNNGRDSNECCLPFFSLFSAASIQVPLSFSPALLWGISIVVPSLVRSDSRGYQNVPLNNNRICNDGRNHLVRMSWLISPPTPKHRCLACHHMGYLLKGQVDLPCWRGIWFSQKQQSRTQAIQNQKPNKQNSI